MKRALSLALLAVLSCDPKPPVTPTGPGSGTTTTDPVVTPDPTTPVTTPAGTAKAIAQPQLLAQPLPNDTARVTIHRLSNGMTVYIAPDPAQPTIVAHVAVKAGSGNDPSQSTGLAHYLEHMLFKGTSKLGTLDYAKEKPTLDKIASLYADLRKPGANRESILKAIDAATQAASDVAVPNELDMTYSRLGITGLNAYTNIDATVYVTQIPKNRIEQWAKIEVTRYSDAVFRLFWPELEAVYEEKNRGLDSPSRNAYEAFLKGLYPKHGYGQPTLGETDHLKAPAYADMVAFYERYYTPQNMAILLAGDVDTSVLPILEKEFGAWKRAPGAAPQTGPLVPLSGRSEVVVTVPSNPGIQLGWHVPSATAKDRDAVELMDLLLLDGQSGILARELLIPQLVADAGCGPQFNRESGYYQMYADALDGQSAADLEKLLLGLVAKVQNGEFTDVDLATSILTAEIREQQLMESNQGRMAVLEQAFFLDDEWANVVSRTERFKKITKADIQRVAKQYLSANYLVVKKDVGKAELPKITKPGITAVKVDPSRHSTFAQQVLGMTVEPIEPVAVVAGKDYERTTLPTGDLVAVKNTRNQLFSLTYEYNYGRRNDRLACFALDLMKVSGAGKLTAQDVARQLHELGLSIDTSCGKNTSSITLSGIDRNMDKGMALLRDWLGAAGVDQATMKAKVAQALTERANTMKSPQGIAQAQAEFSRYGAESDQLVVATNKQLQAATPAQVKKLLATYLALRHRTAYFGPRAIDKAVQPLITLGTGRAPAPAFPPTKYRKPNTVLLTDQQTAQTHVWMIWPRKAATEADNAMGALFGEYVQPLIYQEVREARGLAYTAYGAYGEPDRKVDDASVFVYAGTQGDKTGDAITAIQETLAKPIDDNRLAIAKETIEQNYRTSRLPPRSIGFAIYAWEDAGWKADPRAARTKAVLANDKGALEAWMKAALAQPKIVSIVGDKAKLDAAKLKALGPVTEVPVAKLFGY